MKRPILIFLTIIFISACDSSNYNEEFLGTWKNDNSLSKNESILFEAADDQQLRLEIKRYRSSQTLIMEFVDKNTVQSVQDIFGTKLIYKLKDEDGKVVVIDYILNDKFHKQN